MKTRVRSLLPLLACMGLLALPSAAQTFNTLHSFTGSDGANPYGDLTLSGNMLFGTTKVGGTNGYGVVFAVTTDGKDFTVLHNFNGLYDGADAQAGLALSGNTLFGTTVAGGLAGLGTEFAINTNGNSFSLLNTNGFSTLLYTSNHISYYNEGGVSYGDLVLSGNTLYGLALSGGYYSYGMIFAINTNGSSPTNLYSFDYVNNGGDPRAGLLLSGGTLYGTTPVGGTNGYGTVFAFTIASKAYATIHTFDGVNEGADPRAGLVLSGSTLYGTTSTGGTNGYGTVFSVNADGTKFTVLHTFTGFDGGDTKAGLVLSGNILYGTTPIGGTNNYGTIFAVNVDGAAYTNLYSFTGGEDGYAPYTRLFLSGDTLYGTALGGGIASVTNGYGTVFSFSLLPPLLTIIPSGTNVVLTWPASATGFTLQTATGLDASAIWTTVSPAPVVVNGQNIVTNAISGTQQFYRLGQ